MCLSPQKLSSLVLTPQAYCCIDLQPFCGLLLFLCGGSWLPEGFKSANTKCLNTGSVSIHLQIKGRVSSVQVWTHLSLAVSPVLWLLLNKNISSESNALLYLTTSCINPYLLFIFHVLLGVLRVSLFVVLGSHTFYFSTHPSNITFAFTVKWRSKVSARNGEALLSLSLFYLKDVDTSIPGRKEVKRCRCSPKKLLQCRHDGSISSLL